MVKKIIEIIIYLLEILLPIGKDHTDKYLEL